LQDDVARLAGGAETQRGPHASPLLAQPSSDTGTAIARVLVAHLAAAHGLAVRPELDARLDRARRSLRTSGLPLARALPLMTRGWPSDRAGAGRKPDEADHGGRSLRERGAREASPAGDDRAPALSPGTGGRPARLPRRAGGPGRGARRQGALPRRGDAAAGGEH